MGRGLKGTRMEVPPPFAILQASRGARGGEKPGRRSLEGVGGVLGLWVNFWKGRVFMGRIKFQSLVSCGVAGLPRYHFSAKLNERRNF